MKRLAWKLLTVAALAMGGLLPVISNAAEPVQVVASFSILGDLVQAVGGSRIKVTTLVGPDEDAHAFEPKPAHARAILAAKLFVMNGLDFEPWAHKLAQSAGYKGEMVVTSKGIKPILGMNENGHRQEAADPHAWQNPNNVALYVNNIATGLSKVDPLGATFYQANAQAYVQQLQAFDVWAKSQFAAVAPAKRRVITSHDAFAYLALHYDIKFLAPQGIHPDAEPSAKEVAQLIRQIQRDKIRAVFVENMRSPKLLAQIAKDTGITLGPKLYVDALSVPSEPGGTYLKMMRHNVTQLVAGMKLNSG